MDADWQRHAGHARLKDRAWAQLGHQRQRQPFVEFGTLTVRDDAVGLPRGDVPGAAQPLGQPRQRRQVAAHYSKLARQLHPELPQALAQLAWLDLDTEAGQEYWAAMELMGRYAAANHALIHAHIARALGVEVRLDVENHHNFAWRERHATRRHGGARSSCIARARRRRATACSASSRARWRTPGYVVRGKGVDGVAQLGGARRRPAHEPHAGAKELFTWDGRAAVPARARRHAALGGPGRGADGLQGHRRGDGGAAAIWSSRWRGSSRAS